MYCIYSVSVALYFVVMTKAKSRKPSTSQSQGQSQGQKHMSTCHRMTDYTDFWLREWT